jgi:hypothetical protein
MLGTADADGGALAAAASPSLEPAAAYRTHRDKYKYLLV